MHALKALSRLHFRTRRAKPLMGKGFRVITSYFYESADPSRSVETLTG